MGPITAASTTIAFLLQVALMLGFMGSIDSLLVRLLFISILLTTCGRELNDIGIVISVTIVAIISSTTSTIASLVITSASADIYSATPPIVYIIVVAACMDDSITLAVESASAVTSSYWILDISYAINLMSILVVKGAPNIIRYVEDIRDMSTSNVAADRDLLDYSCPGRASCPIICNDLVRSCFHISDSFFKIMPVVCEHISFFYSNLAVVTHYDSVIQLFDFIIINLKCIDSKQHGLVQLFLWVLHVIVRVMCCTRIWSDNIP